MQQRRGEVLVRSSTSPRVRLPFTCSFAEMFTLQLGIESSTMRASCFYLWEHYVLPVELGTRYASPRTPSCSCGTFPPAPLPLLLFPTFYPDPRHGYRVPCPAQQAFWIVISWENAETGLVKVASPPSRKAPDTKTSTGLHQQRITAHLKAYHFLGRDSKQGAVMRDALALFCVTNLGPASGPLMS